ncbi:universal stress protein [Halorientalis halophila]|uniref:universal stress protein n=1 Tax=Halorientalis halophila TaxID=3108499 RepID=UPI00300BED46
MAERDDHRVLVPVDVLEGEGVPETIIHAIASLPVVILGYHEIPDQTSPEQARTNYGPQVRAELDELRGVFEAAGCDVTTRMVFTHDRFETFERAAVALHCDGTLLLNPAPVLESLLVAVRGDVNLDNIARLVAAFLEGTTIDVTLFHVVTDEENRERGVVTLETAAATLVEHGVEPDRIERVVVEDRPTDAILTAAGDHDLLVIGESRPSIRRYIFRDRAERIAKRTIDPVLVIRRAYLEAPATERERDR